MVFPGCDDGEPAAVGGGGVRGVYSLRECLEALFDPTEWAEESRRHAHTPR